MVDSIIKYHYKPERHCVLETVGPNGEFIDNPAGRCINPGHSFKSYLFTIAYHRIADHFRQQLRHPLLPDYFNYASSFATRNEAEQTLSLEDFLKHLEKAKQKLTPRQRQVFEMSKEQNLSNAEIEQQMGITNQAVRNLLSAAMQTIRREMEPYAPLLLLFLEL